MGSLQKIGRGTSLTRWTQGKRRGGGRQGIIFCGPGREMKVVEQLGGEGGAIPMYKSCFEIT